MNKGSILEGASYKIVSDYINQDSKVRQWNRCNEIIVDILSNTGIVTSIPVKVSSENTYEAAALYDYLDIFLPDIYTDEYYLLGSRPVYRGDVVSQEVQALYLGLRIRGGGRPTSPPLPPL